MIPVVDESGNVVKGLFRLDNGALVVKDPVALSKYNRQKNIHKAQVEKINSLESKVEQLASIVDILLKERN